MKTCAHCGREIEDDVKLCPFCGKTQETEEEPVEEVAEKLTQEAEETFETAADAEEYEEVAYDEEGEFTDESESAAPFRAPNLNIRETLNKLYTRITGKDDEPQFWQLGVGCASLLGALLFLISACLGSVFSLLGVAACLFFGYFALKKPKFNSVAMLVPILLFAFALTSMAGSYHGILDITVDAARSMESLQEDYRASKITNDEYRAERDKMQESVLSASENYLERFAGSEEELDDDMIDEPATADVVIFRILVYAMVGIYLFAQLGRLRSTEISMYSMLLISGASAVYYFIRMFASEGGGMVLFYLASFLFMGAWAVFVYFSEKMSENKKSRVLYRFFRITPASPKKQEGIISISRIAALVIAGVLALLSVYVIVLLFVTTIKLGDYDEMSGYIFRYVLITLFQLALMLGAGFMWYRLSQKIVARDDSFLKHYLILGFITVGIVFVLCSTPAISGWGLVGIAALALAILLCGAVCLARSAQVYEYFGNEKYITQCGLLKKLRLVK